MSGAACAAVIINGGQLRAACEAVLELYDQEQQELVVLQTNDTLELAEAISKATTKVNTALQTCIANATNP
jgi:hypothetical protein